VRIGRRYYACRHCGQTQTPWDAWAGLGDDHLSPQARRLAVLAGSSWSFDLASQRLQEFCHVRISDFVIRRVTQAAGTAAQRWSQTRAAGAAYREAAGAAELYVDGTSVNTRAGWREMRVAVFVKRLPGEPAEPRAWATRCLPRPTARITLARIADSERFGALCGRMARRLGLSRRGSQRRVTVLADGARWIWKQAAQHLPVDECVIDVFHVSEHLHACGRVLHGDGTPAARAWAETSLQRLLQHGPLVLLNELEQQQREQPGRSKRRVARRQALQSLINYLRPNVNGLWYAARLQRGLPIGSGLVEGACKTIIGRRLKAGSARWQPHNADRLAALCCLLHDDQWEAFWKTPAA
jgi:hypothetical protein